MTDNAPTIPGTVNGFRVLGAIEVESLDGPQWIVLCDRGPTINDRYVTWRVRYNPDHSGGAYAASSGNYMTNHANALRNLVNRAGLYTRATND